MRQLPSDLRARTTALAISVNPLVDTRKSVVRFLRERRAQALKYLAGSVAEMKPVWKRFGVVSAYETGDADTHSADVRVFDPEGIWVSTQHSGVDLSPENLAHDIAQAIKGRMDALELIGQGFWNAFQMAWEVWWALMLGFLLSGVVQAWIPRERMERALGGRGPDRFWYVL